MAKIITGLDIGSSTIKAVVAEKAKSEIVIKDIIKKPSRGVRKGVVHDAGAIIPVVAEIFEEVREISKKAPKHVYINTSSPKVSAQQSRGTAAVSRADNEVYQEDVDRAKKNSEAISTNKNRTVIHALTQEFVVDNIEGVLDPIGLSATRLEVLSLIVDTFTPHIDDLVQIVDTAGGSVDGVFLSPLAASRAALSRQQKELGCVLVDIGFGTTSIAVYEEEKLLGVKVFPVGAGNVTNDIAVGLKIPVDVAEKIKLHYGNALAKNVNRKDSVELNQFMSESEASVSRRFVAEIIEARLSEVFEFVDNELKLLGKSGQLAGGVVLTGGGAKLPGLTELARQELKLTSQIGFGGADRWGSGGTTHFLDELEDPDLVDVLGLILFGADQEGWWGEGGVQTPANIRKVIDYFLP